MSEPEDIIEELRFLGPLAVDGVRCMEIRSVCERAADEIERLRACHDSELGVCEKHCDVVASLKREVTDLDIQLRTAKAETGWIKWTGEKP